MANIVESGERSSFSLSLVTAAELKAFLAENNLPTTGRKQELQERAVNILETEDLLYVIEASAFVDLTIPAAPILCLQIYVDQASICPQIHCAPR